MVVAFWRALTAGCLVLVVLLAVQGTKAFFAVFRTGWPGLIYTVLIGTTAPAFVLAVTQTSVANVVFIFASMPVFAAAFSRMFLGEPIQTRMMLTMAAVIFGIGVIAYGSGESEIASWKGDFWALYVSAAFAAALTAVRKVKATSMIFSHSVRLYRGRCSVGDVHRTTGEFCTAMATLSCPWRLHWRSFVPSGCRSALHQLCRGFAFDPVGICPRADSGLGGHRRGPRTMGDRRRHYRNRCVVGVKSGQSAATEGEIRRLLRVNAESPRSLSVAAVLTENAALSLRTASIAKQMPTEVLSKSPAGKETVHC